MEATQVMRPPRAPRERLASLKGPRRSLVGRRIPHARPQIRCTNPGCESPDVQEVDDGLVCMNCGTQVSENNIVSEVTFGETSTGAAVVQGGFVGEGQRHAKSLGSAFRRVGGVDSRQMTEARGKDELRRQANALGLKDYHIDTAFGIYKLALANNFKQGRKTRTVAAVCLYIACRKDPKNTTMLIDFSEIIRLNVFKLGQVYQDLKKDLWLGEFDKSGIRPVIEVENLILRFARRLEFGDSTLKVAEDAAKILKRMKRDWMVTGRRPAGLCGACIILAARMNNFRRTVREVVYIVKVADMTVAKRLEEFKRTQASDLTVEQFRTHGLRLKKSHDPPALYEAKERERKRQLKLAKARASTAEVITDDESQAESDDATDQPPRKLRRDADGFAIPELPIDPVLRESSVDSLRSSPPLSESATVSRSSSVDPDRERPKRKRTRGSTSASEERPLLELTEADLMNDDEVLDEDERQLESEIEGVLSDPAAVHNMEDTAWDESQARAEALANTLRNKSSTSSAADAQMPALVVSDERIIGEDEFEGDPEVDDCLLSEAEQRIKERIWVTHNEDWLRAQQARTLKKALDEAHGKTKRPSTRKRKVGRMGDGSVLEGGTPVQSPADANQRMLEKRSKGFSKHINYEKLNEVFRGLYGSSSSVATEITNLSENETASEAGSVAAVAGAREGSVDMISHTVMKTLEPRAVGGMLPTPEATQKTSGTTGGGETDQTMPGSRSDPEIVGKPDDQQGRGRVEAIDEDVEIVEGPAEGRDTIDEEVDEEDDYEEEDVDERAVLNELGIDAGDYEEDEEAGFDEEDLED